MTITPASQLDAADERASFRTRFVAADDPSIGAHLDGNPQDPFAMGADYQPAKGMRKFISGTPPVLAMQPLKDMIELIAEAGIPAARQKSTALGRPTASASVCLR